LGLVSGKEFQHLLLARLYLGYGLRVRMTRNVRAILAALLAAPEPCQVRFGYEIVQETGLTSGSVYPVLHRLEDEGWLVSGEEPSQTKGRPPRRCYRFTDFGRAEATRVLNPPSGNDTQ
jgi:PadR family transcriptional regulator PadR